MSEPKPMDRAEVEARLNRAGLKLSTAQVDELHAVSGYLQRWVDIVNAPRPKGAEPATIFTREPT